jgi:hypothetical protein
MNYITLFFVAVIVIFFIYLIIDFFTSGSTNAFMNKWALKIIWIWLPFYAFYFLAKKIFERKQ